MQRSRPVSQCCIQHYNTSSIKLATAAAVLLFGVISTYGLQPELVLAMQVTALPSTAAASTAVCMPLLQAFCLVTVTSGTTETLKLMHVLVVAPLNLIVVAAVLVLAVVIPQQ